MKSLSFPQIFEQEPDVTGDAAKEIEETFGFPYTTSAQNENGQDIQGIPWHALNRSREHYRRERIQSYTNFENEVPDRSELQHLSKEITPCEPVSRLYKFKLNTRSLNPSHTHLQLRYMVWATSSHDVYVMCQHFVNTNYEYEIVHWDAKTHRCQQICDLSAGMFSTSDHDTLRVCSMVVKEGIMLLGGQIGELVCMNIQTGTFYYNQQISTSENNITNSIDLYQSYTGALRVVTSNNDCIVRIFNLPNFEELSSFQFPAAVNHTSPSPDGRLFCVAGDMKPVYLLDSRTGKKFATLNGHLDYSFSCSWHPDGLLVATGNQDKTCRVWDIRNPSKSVAVIKGEIAAIRSVKFNENGSVLGLSEAADFLHLVDVGKNFEQKQVVDVFGEISGFCFTPDAEGLFLGINDGNFGGLMEFERIHHGPLSQYF